MRVLVLRPKSEEDDLVHSISAMGLEPVRVPAIRLTEIPGWQLPKRNFDWLVFTSVKGVSIFAARAELNRFGHVAAVGPKTADALRHRGVRPSFVPSEYTTEAVGRDLPGPASVMLIRGSYGDDDLETVLKRRAFEVERVNVYTTEHVGARDIRNAVAAGVDAIAFTSPSIVYSFVASGAGVSNELILSIGPATTRACVRSGLQVDVEASEHTGAGLARAIEREVVRV